MGESGSGKSTLLQVLQKFYEFEEGEIYINGIPWVQTAIPTWRNCIGVVPQNVKIFNGTLIDNICLGDSTKEAQAVIDFCTSNGFNRYFESFPQRYLTLLGEEGTNISGGEQQLVALCRALYNKPQLLLLDEPTAAMDTNMESFVIDLIGEMKARMGIIIVTHRLKISRLADRIYIIEKGKVVIEGSQAELLNSDNFYSRAYSEIII